MSTEGKVKLLCSHGGKILPRPADGQLKYVGGETRVISIPRDINFPEIMKKLTYLIDGDMILKYQFFPEDLDALVSVKSNDDLRHMFDEYDRQESQGTPRLRTFLFPAYPIEIDNQTGPIEPHAHEQRYIDAINGMIHTTTAPRLGLNPAAATYSITSACSSPRSPESCTTDATNHESMLLYQNGMIHMNKIHSSPSVCSLNKQHQSNQQTQHHQYYPQHNHHHYHHQSNKLPPDPHHHKSGGLEHLIKVRSVGQAESSRYHTDPTPRYYYSTTKHSRVSVCCNKCRHCNENGASMDKRLDRTDSIPPSSSLPPSPRRNSYRVKVWDSVI